MIENHLVDPVILLFLFEKSHFRRSFYSLLSNINVWKRAVDTIVAPKSIWRRIVKFLFQGYINFTIQLIYSIDSRHEIQTTQTFILQFVQNLH